MSLARTNLLGQVTSSVGINDFNTNAFTPPSQSLLVVAATFIENSGTVTDPTSSFVVSDSGGHVWTERATAVVSPTSFPTLTKVWTAPVVSGASISLVLSTGGRNALGYAVSVVGYTGYNTSSPVGSNASGTKGGGFTGPPDPANIMLGVNPASTSEVFAAIGVDRTGGSVDPGAGWTEIDDLFNPVDIGLETEIRTNSTSNSVDWSDLRNGGGALFNYAAVAVEIKGQTVAPGVVPSKAGTITFETPQDVFVSETSTQVIAHSTPVGRVL